MRATTHLRDPAILAEVSAGLSDPMPGLEISKIPQGDLLQSRG